MKTLPVGLQIYSVRDFAERDFRGTMHALKEMGYDYAELAGMYSYTPEQLKTICGDEGIKVISAHVPFAELIGDTAAVIEAYKFIGCKYIAVPYLDEATRAGSPAFEDTLKKIEEIGRVAQSKGVQLMYHNHDFEFIRMPDGSYAFDYMYNKIPSKYLASEIDTCWVKVAGEDPAAYIRKYAGRCPVVHLKDFKGQKSEGMYELIGIEKKAKATEAFAFQPVGHGVQDFPPILAASLESGAEYVVVEQDRSDERPSMEAVKLSREYLRSLGW